MFKFVMGLLIMGALSLGAKPTHAGPPPAPSGTIAIAAGSDLSYGGVVTFDFTSANLPNKVANTVVRNRCFQSGLMVYEEWGAATGFEFVLGLDGLSIWGLNGGGPANCIAQIGYWVFHPHDVYIVLDEVTYEATG